MVVDQEHTGIMRKKTHPRQLGVPLNRWGRNLISCCPFHSPEETSLFFYDALGYWRYRCLQCGSDNIRIWDKRTCPKCQGEMEDTGEKEFWT